jgi:hypothetical protein
MFEQIYILTFLDQNTMHPCINASCYPIDMYNLCVFMYQLKIGLIKIIVNKIGTLKYN